MHIYWYPVQLPAQGRRDQYKVTISKSPGQLPPDGTSQDQILCGISSEKNPFKLLVLAPLRPLEQLYSPWAAYEQQPLHLCNPPKEMEPNSPVSQTIYPISAPYWTLPLQGLAGTR